MNFELGKEYIVKVSEDGIIPIEEFRSDRFFDIESSDLDFLTDEEKTVVINDVLDKIRAEIVDLGQRAMNDNRASGIWACRDIIDKYKRESEDKE